MDYGLYKAKAPGSFMLMGEHAVLRGQFAVVCAANQWITVTLQPQTSSYIHIISPTLGTYICHLNKIKVEPPYQFILGVISLFKPYLHQGFTLTIESDFSHAIGLGSSAAVTIATLAVLAKWLEQEISKQNLFIKALQVIQSVQGAGSGADLAASLYGGVLAYQSNPIHIEKLPLINRINLIYCGYKTPTAKVIEIVNNHYQANPAFYAHLFECIGYCSQQAIQAIKHQQWEQLGSLMKTHHCLQKALGCSDKIMDEIIHQLDYLDSIIGAKISGSGLGDCIVALGNLPENTFPKDKQQQQRNIYQMMIEVTNQGLTFVE